MKKSVLLSLCGILISSSVFSASKATDKKFSYCSDITQIDKLLDRSQETVDRIKAEGLQVERIVVSKDRKELYLVSGDVLLKSYAVAFGSKYL